MTGVFAEIMLGGKSGPEQIHSMHESVWSEDKISSLIAEYERCAPRLRPSGMSRRQRLTAILRTIDQQIGDPDLSASSVAAVLGITPRYVHLLLEETGKSFTHHVLDRRLDKAVTMLRDPRWRHRKIAEIAAEADFTDLSYFNRAFRRRYRMTPSAIRDKS